MFANLDIAVSVIAVCAVSMTLCGDSWSLSYILSDVSLYVFGIVACWVVSRRFMAKSATQKAKNEPGDDLASSSTEHSGDVASESVPTQGESKAIDVERHSEMQFDTDKHVAMMQKFASERNIGGTIRTFRLIQQSGVDLSSLMYNIVLQAWIDCGNVQAAEDWMEDINEAGMTNESSFNILIKALVEARAMGKAKDVLRDMKKTGIQPGVATFDELLTGFVRASRFNESLSLLEQMHSQCVQPSSITLNNITVLMNGARKIDQGFGRISQIVRKFNLQTTTSGHGDTHIADTLPLPRLAATIYQAQDDSIAPCAHEIHVTGSLSHVKAFRKTLKQHGFLDKSESCESPLDGHWETDHGLTVVIEGKLVRWGGQRASVLRFTQEDRSACTLGLYGETAHGQLVPQTPSEFSASARKMLRWDNGDTWHSYDGRAIGQDVLFSQTMSKALSDKAQDNVYRARSNAVLRCVSKQALGIPAILETTIMQFLGSDLFHVRVNFASKWNPTGVDDDDELPLMDLDSDICDSLSRRHPHVGLRHCWAEKGANCCGQRTLINGKEVDEASFSRHVGMVRWS